VPPQTLLRQKDAELKQANAELEERGKLLYKTKVRAAFRPHEGGSPGCHVNTLPLHQLAPSRTLALNAHTGPTRWPSSSSRRSSPPAAKKSRQSGTRRRGCVGLQGGDSAVLWAGWWVHAPSTVTVGEVFDGRLPLTSHACRYAMTKPPSCGVLKSSCSRWRRP
jgi:hypothetical protein